MAEYIVTIDGGNLGVAHQLGDDVAQLAEAGLDPALLGTQLGELGNLVGAVVKANPSARLGVGEHDLEGVVGRLGAVDVGRRDLAVKRRQDVVLPESLACVAEQSPVHAPTLSSRFDAVDPEVEPAVDTDSQTVGGPVTPSCQTS